MSSDKMEMPEMKTIYEHPRPSPPRMTFEEFLAWDSEFMMSEWVDGEVIVMSPTARRHQEIFSLLLTALGLYVESHQLGVVLPAPFVMRFMEKRRGREPDLLFVSRERAHLIKPTYMDGAADMVVEIVSPESIKRDRVEKYAEYETAGIKEYWLIDPDRESAEFYELDAGGRYRAADTQPEGLYRSQVVPGFFIRTSWLWQTPSPTLGALRELGLI